MIERRKARIALGLSLAITGAFFLVSPQTHHYTDHLRHMGEAVAFVNRGFAIYSSTYRESVRGLRLPCPEHADLWADQPIPYPPCGILLHWPVAVLESRGWIAPPLSHRLIVTGWLALGCAACALAWRLFERQPRAAQAGLWLVFIPLTIGIGANGFYDVAYIFCAVLGLIFVQRGRVAGALVLFALSISLHFRALVFAPMLAVAVHQLWMRERGRALWHFVVPILLLAPAAAAAWMVQKNAAAFYPHNPVHYSHHSISFATLTVAGIGGVLVFTFLSQHATSATLAASWALTVVDPLHGWWHAAVLTAPALVLASGTPRAPSPARLGWLAAWGWAVLGGYCAFRHPLSPYWQWVEFAIRGVH